MAYLAVKYTTLHCFMKNAGRIKMVLLFVAVFIAFLFLYMSGRLVDDLSVEEQHKMEVWAEAMHTMNTADEHMDLNLVLKVLNANNTIPVIVVDQADNVLLYRNVDVQVRDSTNSVERALEKLKRVDKVIRMNYGNQEYIDVYYDESVILKRLSVYPYVQIVVILVFMGVVLFALSSFKKSEQNLVWVGLSKETAHQLGTPISSLMAWLELMKLKYADDDLLMPMAEDVQRLQMIANRFSKIGSSPELEQTELIGLLDGTINYMSRRASAKIEIIKKYPAQEVYVNINGFLFSWVIENLCKNAMDAMGGQGRITVSVTNAESVLYIDVADTGKGIARNKFRAVFSPGFTTKRRGWGLGLSLARRIVEEYHYGRIYVKESALGSGTTFRIELKK